MFAKVFSQIFDSSIAEDYNCRRMFMDLLVLADSDGVVDMTLEAISRRTNVPLNEVERYIRELQQPDTSSRSKLEEGKRLVQIDTAREWGWRIVNYHHYRKIRDEEARRSYFRDAKRKQRKSKNIRERVLDNSVDNGGQRGTMVDAVKPFPLSSSSVQKKESAERKRRDRCTQSEAEDFCASLGLPRSDGTAMFLHWEEKGWFKIKDWQLTIRKWKEFGYLPSQKKTQWGKQPAPQTDLDREYEEHQKRMAERKANEQRTKGS